MNKIIRLEFLLYISCFYLSSYKSLISSLTNRSIFSRFVKRWSARSRCIAVTGVAGPEREAPFAGCADIRRSITHTHTNTHAHACTQMHIYIAFRGASSTKLQEMKWHTRRGLSLENDLLRSVARRCARIKPDPPSHIDAPAYVHTIASVRILASPAVLLFTSFFLFLPLPPPSRAPSSLLSSSGERRSAETGERARMICNFNNQSHERRLIFIMITPPLYLAWEREPGIGVSTQNGPHGTKELHRSPRAKGTLRSWLV